jgi:hypothetical protein
MLLKTCLTFFKQLSFIFCFWMLCYSANGQGINLAARSIREADSLYRRVRFKQSAERYFAAFGQSRSSHTSVNLFNAAKACARAHYADSAYKYLLIIAESKDNHFFDPIVNEPDFISLHFDARWRQVTAIIKKQQGIFNRPVSDELIALRKERLKLEEKRFFMIDQYGARSARVKKFQDTLDAVDTINIHKWKSIINTYGWPGVEEVGAEAELSLLFIYNKANMSAQKVFFPTIAEAFKHQEIDADSYAVIADRISLFDTGRQIYGTQVKADTHELLPVENKDSLSIRRRVIGLKGEL